MDYRDAMNIALSLLMLVGGFLLNRVFVELDRLRQADSDMARALSELKPSMIDRAAFERHVDKEETRGDEIWAAVSDLRGMVQQLLVEVASLRANHLGGPGRQP